MINEWFVGKYTVKRTSLNLVTNNETTVENHLSAYFIIVNMILWNMNLSHRWIVIGEVVISYDRKIFFDRMPTFMIIILYVHMEFMFCCMMLVMLF